MTYLKPFILAISLLMTAICFAAGTVNINTADKDTLVTMIKGIGERKAEAIIADREKNGPFMTIDELSRVKGIGQSTVDDNREVLSVSQE